MSLSWNSQMQLAKQMFLFQVNIQETVYIWVNVKLHNNYQTIGKGPSFRN